MGYKGFIRAVFRCFNPNAYFELSNLKIKQSLSYLLKLLFFVFVVMLILYIPFLIKFQSKIDDKLNNFNTLSIKINASMKKPIVFFENTNKQLIINTNANTTEFENGMFLITNDSFVKKRFLFGYEVKNMTGYSNVLEHRDFYKGIVTLMFILLLPSILIILFLFYSIKYFIMAFVVSFLSLIIVRLIRFEIDYKSILNITIFSLTPSILFELIIKPFNITIPYFKIHWIGYIVSLFYLVYGISQTGYFDREKKYKKKRDYLSYSGF